MFRLLTFTETSISDTSDHWTGLVQVAIGLQTVIFLVILSPCKQNEMFKPVFDKLLFHSAEALIMIYILFSWVSRCWVEFLFFFGKFQIKTAKTPQKNPCVINTMGVCPFVDMALKPDSIFMPWFLIWHSLSFHSEQNNQGWSLMHELFSAIKINRFTRAKDSCLSNILRSSKITLSLCCVIDWFSIKHLVFE